MSNTEPAFFSDDNCQFQATQLSDGAYIEALTSMVIVCADILFFSREKNVVYLAKRIAKPLSNWWLIGGRIRAGEEARLGAIRNLQRETGLIVDPGRLLFLSMNRYFFNERQQAPQDIACDSLSYTFALDISDVELASVQKGLSATEYAQGGVTAFTYEEAMNLDTHPAVRYLVSLLK